MGSFEKLGILVIVIIIVMILAVAIHQWGGGAAPHDLDPLRVQVPPAPEPSDIRLEDIIEGPSTSGETWADGTPKRYTIRSGDVVSKLVQVRWNLKYSFIEEIRKANPERNMIRLLPGDVLVIPDTADYQRGGSSGSHAGEPAPAPSRMRRYEIQEGDTLESIARKLLGRKSRWTRIRDANPGLKPERLRPGQTILIPIP
jgi:nucleoid-associated protein YgaU